MAGNNLASLDERFDEFAEAARVGLNELDYGDVVYRFQDSGRLEEVTLQARVVRLGTETASIPSLHFIEEQVANLPAR